METVHLSKKDVNEFNVRQNLLIKRTIGVSKFAKTKPLFQVLRIESIPQLYVKHKVFFFKQVMRNKLAKECYNYLEKHYVGRNTPNNDSFAAQIRIANKELGFDIRVSTSNSIKEIEKLNFINNKGLIDSLLFVIKNHYKEKYGDMIKFINNLSNYENYVG